MGEALSYLSMVCLAAVALYLARHALCELGWLPKPKSCLTLARNCAAHPFLAILILFLVTRVLLYWAGTARYGLDPTLSPLEGFAKLWSGADTEHFVRISRFGYEPGGEYQNLIVFYPLYPLLMRLVGFVVPIPELAGIVISNAALLGACWLIYRLALECRLSPGEGLLAVAFLLAFPFAVFLQSCYTEGLFLLLSTGCALALLKGNWVWGGVLGGLAALTRTQGVLLIAIAAYELAKQWKTTNRRRAAAVLLIPAGFGIYLLFNLALYQNAFAYLAYEKAAPWYQSVGWFFDNIRQNYEMAVGYPGLAQFIYAPQILLFFGTLACLGAGVKQGVRTSLLLYGGVYLLLSYSASWLLSGGRYLLCAFPIYFVLARAAKRRPLFGGVLLACSAILLYYYTMGFLRGEAIM